MYALLFGLEITILDWKIEGSYHGYSVYSQYTRLQKNLLILILKKTIHNEACLFENEMLMWIFVIITNDKKDIY